MRELIKGVEQWAVDKGIIGAGNWVAHIDKTHEEAEELLCEIEDGHPQEAMMEMGDVIVTLIVQCKMQGWDFEECLRMAYDKISKRNGVLVDGVFVKEAE